MKIDNQQLEKIFIYIKENRKFGIEKLYNNYKKMIYGISFTITKSQEDSEDITQIIFTKIYEMGDDKFPRKNYSSWLYSITKNETINYIKQKRNNISLENIYEIPENNNELDAVLDRMTFNNLINKLNNKEKEVVSLKILSNFSFEEIANLLEEPVGTVKWRYYKSIYSLKSILGNLAIFIVSFIIGIKTLLSKNTYTNISKQENIEQNTEEQKNVTNSTLLDEDTSPNKSEDYNNQTTQEESVKQNLDTTNTATNTNVMQDTNTTTQENIIYEEQPINNYTQYIGYSFLGISIIFLVISLYFLIKYQLKHLKELSK